MTSDEHAHLQELEGLVKRYRSRIVALKAQVAVLEADKFRLEGALERIQTTSGDPVIENICAGALQAQFVLADE